MTAEHVFSAANLIAMVGWLILIVGARRRWVATLVTGAILPLLFAVLYGLLIATHWGEKTGGFGTLAQVHALFSNDWLLLAGWVHYFARLQDGTVIRLEFRHGLPFLLETTAHFIADS